MYQPTTAYADALAAAILADRRAEGDRDRLIRRAGVGRRFAPPTLIGQAAAKLAALAALTLKVA